MSLFNNHFDVVESLLCSPKKVQVGEVKQMVNKFLCESNLDLQKSMIKMLEMLWALLIFQSSH
jgi:hypothetical protein